jgi:signal transduction histidine kinase
LIKANETIGKAITEIRTISRALDKDWLEQFSFRENLIVEISRINAGGSITATLQDIPLELKAESQVILFRIVQESLQNAIKHAKPKHIDVLIREANNELTITVENDGEQFSEEDHHSAGMGLTNMKQRTALLGGKIAWIKKEAGTQLNISLPLLKNNI